MRLIFFLLLISTCATAQKPVKIFDGESFNGWEGDTVNTWRINKGELVGGSLEDTVPHNQFLASVKPYRNFVLKLKFKLTGTEGFINSGIQFHSQRITNPSYEMKGYQADLGEGYWACLYDESRRNKVLAYADTNVVKSALKKDDWNEYEVRSVNGRIQIKLNGKQTVDYTEPDKSIPQQGLIALQIHEGGKAEVRFKDIFLTELE